ncbi:conserved hypothetical protein [Nitrosopumilaceae archaeon]|nr:hypothetical protein [Nitrosopumilus sp.]CAI9831139.1 conserved hypothetical protein [Nitrosopumilaceae archaeon]MDA7941241.1 hypothetical protein [Nitrosopumilus sp.]MDA7942651.1 hypothetical protein [Nitrosopumilus sp.]MDA7945205.1 hypothetical protein [Nitrosopumilus sp.]
MAGSRYARWTVEGDVETRWMCGCIQTVDGYFGFCQKHRPTLEADIRARIDELDKQS